MMRYCSTCGQTNDNWIGLVHVVPTIEDAWSDGTVYAPERIVWVKCS